MIKSKNKGRNPNINMLAADPETAMRQLVRLTRELVKFAEAETGALVRGDMIKLAATQDDKEKLARQYSKASEEFRSRIEQFRGIDKKIIAELEAAQAELARKSEENNVLMARLRARSYGGTHTTLLTAQEMGQSRLNRDNREHKGA